MLGESSRRATVAAPDIERRRKLLQANCNTCKNSKALCDECSCRWLKYRAAHIANLPIAKVEYCWNTVMPERWVWPFQFPLDLDGDPKGQLGERTQLYETVVTPYLDNAAKIVASGHSLFFAGDNSLGKTTAAVYVALGFLARGYPSYFMRFPDLHKLHTQSTSGTPEVRSEALALLDEIQSIDFLVVDELGGETNASESVRYLADTFLKVREESCLPTLMITNTAFHALGTKPEAGHHGYGRRFWAMLQERYRVYIFRKMDKAAPNLRLKNQLPWPF